ncbi:MAG: energy transducer TonB [Flavobacteriales bacterium]|jgi:TonB family protein|nr:energy transducer TonB [Flavobacteriales bacterium]MBL1233888.1 energy transducer TonB [Flavobacteriales bacterium]
MKKIILLSVLLLLTIMNFFAQSKSKTINNNYKEVLLPAIQENGEIIIFDQAPMYPNGVNGIMEHLGKNVKYPKKAKRKNIQGRVLLKFTVQKDGSVGNIEIIESVDPLLDAESIRVIKLMEKWIPGLLNGEKVSVSFNLPIKFSLKENK